MILRKPYKFLIKHFKLIHLLLFLPVLYLIIKTNEINSFFNQYITNNYSFSYISNLAGSYINVFMYLAILVIFGMVLAVYYLMQQKKKPTKLYIGFIVYYIILFVGITYCYSVLSGMELVDLTAKSSRTYRDIFFVLFLPQYFFAFFSIFRGLGFDIKSFKFELDLKDLDISAEDNEEFEFVLGVETYKYKRTARRFIREFRYYILENKFMFTCISIIFVLVVGTIIFMDLFVYNKTYYKNSDFSHSAFNIRMEDSILTNMDYNGNTITDGKYYLVLKLFIANKTYRKTDIDIDNFRLQFKDDYVKPKLDRSQYFTDFAAQYNGEKILGYSENTYNLVYELDKSQVKRNYKIKILESIDYKVGDITAHYKILDLRPTRLFEINDEGKYNIGDKISFSESMLGNTTFKVNSFEVTDNYYYNYEVCISDCRSIQDVVGIDYASSISKNTLLVLDTTLEQDKDNLYFKNMKNINNFYEDYFTVSINGNEYTTKCITPSNLKDKVILKVPAQIKDKNFDLVVTIRNKSYSIKLKR